MSHLPQGQPPRFSANSSWTFSSNSTTGSTPRHLPPNSSTSRLPPLNASTSPPISRLPPPPPRSSTPSTPLSSTSSTPETSVQFLLRSFSALLLLLQSQQPSEYLVPPSIPAPQVEAWVKVQKKRTEEREKKLVEGWEVLSRGVVRVVRDLVVEEKNGGDQEEEKTREVLRELRKENEELRKDKEVLEKRVERVEDAMLAMEARFEARFKGMGAQIGAGIEESKNQLVSVMERMVDVAQEVGRKRKAEEGTLWGEMERVKKRMVGVEKLGPRVEGVEKEATERDVERQEAVDLVVQVKARLDNVEQDVSTIKVSPLPTPPAETPLDSFLHPNDQARFLDQLSTSISDLSTQVTSLTATSATKTSTELVAETLRKALDGVRSQVEKLAKDVEGGKKLEEGFVALGKVCEDEFGKMRQLDAWARQQNNDLKPFVAGMLGLLPGLEALFQAVENAGLL